MLAKVESVGVRGDRQVGVVVDDEGGVMGVAEISEAAGHGKLVSLVVELVAVLNGGGAPAQGGGGDLHRVTAPGALRVDDDVEAGDSTGAVGTEGGVLGDGGCVGGEHWRLLVD